MNILQNTVGANISRNTVTKYNHFDTVQNIILNGVALSVHPVYKFEMQPLQDFDWHLNAHL